MFVDIKAAFDCVDRVDRLSVWKALRGKDAPDIVLKLLDDLHTHTGAKVRSGGKLSG